ncbi:helix-turn-helix domain-containing protein [Bacillus horti]|uniref:XRE family transcriptional regulator of biofilm formation n=1 Tax=Caldalkalibacillus horti TaxID=77523 RepID=A0ABT9W429_9BACI|nr:helix-turn-helix domain-containing protein [Bacillus horti]MDQ0167986.1 XRE family transcriptional regulator of biofilm formation [Bacillus horti]
MIGKKIQALRKERGLSLSELADKADIAKSYLSSIERDIQKNPSIQFLEKIAGVLDVPIQSLIHEESVTEALDQEWLELVKEAMESNITKEEFKDFLEFTKWKQQQK